MAHATIVSLKNDARYLVRVIYDDEEQWFTWDERYRLIAVMSPIGVKEKEPKHLEW